jgi:uncharacterized protein YjiS (DUF1127 family)
MIRIEDAAELYAAMDRWEARRRKRWEPWTKVSLGLALLGFLGPSVSKVTAIPTLIIACLYIGEQIHMRRSQRALARLLDRQVYGFEDEEY